MDIWVQSQIREFRTQRNRQNFSKLCMVFNIQIILLFAMVWSVNIGPRLAGEDKSNDDDEDYPFLVLCSKVFCSILLHLQMQPSMDDAIERLFYLKNHPHKFDSIVMPYIICLMKLTVDFLTEVICLSITATFNAPHDILMNYIALGCISGLDELVFATIRSPLKEQMEEEENSMPIENFNGIAYWKELNFFYKFLFSLLKPLQILYQTLYFHLFHYGIFVFLFFRKGFGDLVN